MDTAVVQSITRTLAEFKTTMNAELSKFSTALCQHIDSIFKENPPQSFLDSYSLDYTLRKVMSISIPLYIQNLEEVGTLCTGWHKYFVELKSAFDTHVGDFVDKLRALEDAQFEQQIGWMQQEHERRLSILIQMDPTGPSPAATPHSQQWTGFAPQYPGMQKADAAPNFVPEFQDQYGRADQRAPFDPRAHHAASPGYAPPGAGRAPFQPQQHAFQPAPAQPGLPSNQDMSYALLGRHHITLLDWVKKSKIEVMYDTERDGWKHDDFFKAVMNREWYAIISFTSDGYVFGTYIQEKVTTPMQWVQDENHFLFLLQTPNPSVTTPCRWFKNQRLKHWKKVIQFSQVTPKTQWFFQVGVINCYISSSRTSPNNYFNNISQSYVNLGDTDLAGVNGKDDPYILDRMIIVQFS